MIKASEYCVKIFDGTHDTPKSTQDGEYLVTSKCLLDGKIDFSSAYKISEDDYDEVNRRSQVSQYDILFSMIGTIGNTYLEESSDINYAIKNIGVFSCRNREKAIFLYYYLQSPYAKKYIERGLDGAVQKFLSLEKMRNFPVPEFSESAYKAISELRRIDDKISTNNKIIETSEKLMREIYDYWFVQFDFPDENGRPYKSSGGEMVYDEKLKREIPKGWRTLELGDIIKEAKKSSVQVNGARERAGSYPFFTSGDEILDFDEYYVDGFNIFLNTGGNADIKSYYGKSAYSTDTWCISADKYSYMLFIFLDSIKEQINNNCFAGSGLKHLQKNAFKKIKIVAPEDNLLRTFNDLAQSSYQAISSYKTENKKLASLRDWLLPMLMNGQIKVSD